MDAAFLRHRLLKMSSMVGRVEPVTELAESTALCSVAKSKSKSILVQMMSAAGTGYCFNAKRSRLRDKLVLRKHDPRVNKHVLFFEKRKIRSI
ncbi:39S ribosomal protein L33, mitochondrial isoform X2 [Pristis pectinata]|uniref:39S ribosomal protein L33, mitochondrial isoform X2 n=1 Tax=Pristis pectinata TaxID=685728 RepID=UPI00223DC9FE|nr:39S ribosomal protein L33, mitochondrial isoform X2 [Pristis pectinata]